METSAPSQRIYRFGHFEADLGRGRLSSRGVTVRIPEQSFAALRLLLDHHGEIVTRDEFRRQIWPDGTFVEFEGSLNAILKRLRAALDDDADNPRFIETLPRRGYRFIAPVTLASANGSADTAPAAHEASALHPAPQEAIAAVPSNSAMPSPWRRWAAIAAIVLLAAGAGYLALRGRLKNASAASSTNPSAARPVVQRRSLAVLGFQNATGKSDDAWLSTALSEMLSTELAAGDKLRLVSGEDVAHLRASSPWSESDTLGAGTASRIGTSLSSDLLVLGSYTSVGANPNRQIRVDARLQDAKSGEILTEVAVVGGDQNLFELVSRVGGLLRDRLGISPVQPADETSVLASLPSNVQASRFYSLGLEKLRDFDYRTAKDLFDQAIHADPSFPLAHSMASVADHALGFEDECKQQAKLGRDLSEKLSPVQRMEIEASYYEAYSQHSKAADTYRVLFTLYPDNLDYGLRLADSQTQSYKREEAIETLRELRQLPAPLRDDPRIDLQEGWVVRAIDVTRGDALLQTAASKARTQNRQLIAAKAMQRICLDNLNHLSDPPECDQAYEIFNAAGNRAEAGYCVQVHAEAQRLTGHDDAAIKLYEKALRLFQEAGAPRQTAVALNNMSLALVDNANWSEAEVRYTQAKKIFQEVNDIGSVSAVLANLGDIQELRGNLKQSANLYRQAWELGQATGAADGEGSRVNYGALLLARGEIQEARQEVDPQIEIYRRIAENAWDMLAALSVRGDINLAAADLDGARKFYQEAFDVMKKVNSPTVLQELSLADLATEEGHPADAENAARRALVDIEKNGSAGDQIDGYQSLAKALLAEGKYPEAQDCVARAMKIGEASQFPGVYLPLRILQARIRSAAAGSGNRAAQADAQRELSAIITQAKALEMYQFEIAARLALGESELHTNAAAARNSLTALATETHAKGYDLVSKKANAFLAATPPVASK